jgi:hypothetical protein
MPSQLLDLKSPQDMWRKADRELQRFENEPSVDHAYNFFVSIYHLRDYAKVAGLDLGVLDGDTDFELCRLACNSGKHLQLTGRTAADASGRSFDTHADLAFSGHEEFAVLADGQRIPVLELGRRVLDRLRPWLGLA